MKFEGELQNERLMVRRGRELTLHRARKERLLRMRDLAARMLQLMPQGLPMEPECEEIKTLIDEVQAINKMSTADEPIE